MGTISNFPLYSVDRCSKTGSTERFSTAKIRGSFKSAGGTTEYNTFAHVDYLEGRAPREFEVYSIDYYDGVLATYEVVTENNQVETIDTIPVSIPNYYTYSYEVESLYDFDFDSTLFHPALTLNKGETYAEGNTITSTRECFVITGYDGTLKKVNFYELNGYVICLSPEG